MLVYHKEPMGYTSIEGQRVYGKCFSYGSFGPTDISRSLFRKNRDILEEFVYTTKWLEEKFNKKFPNISFKISEFYKIDFELLVKIAKTIGIEYIKSRKSSDLERRALRRAVLNKITV